MEVIKKNILPLLFLLFLAGSSSGLLGRVHAQSKGYVPLAPLPGTTGAPLCDIDPLTGQAICEESTEVTLRTYLPGIFKLSIGLAGVLAVIMIVIGGLQYMSTDAIGGKSEGRDRITAAISGLLLALGAYILLNTISPNLVQFNLNIAPVGVTTQGPPVAPPLPACSSFSLNRKTCGDERVGTCTVLTEPFIVAQDCPPPKTVFSHERDCALKYGLCTPS